MRSKKRDIIILTKLNFSWNGQEKKELESRSSCSILEFGGIQQSNAVENERAEAAVAIRPKVGQGRSEREPRPKWAREEVQEASSLLWLSIADAEDAGLIIAVKLNTTFRQGRV